jgi:NADP-dependent aldehyde dehydrogenase
MPAAVERAFWLQPDMRDATRRAAMLRAVAAALAHARDRIITAASAETALTPEELAPEFARMTRTLEMFAGVVEDGRWTRESHTPPAADPADAIGPNHDLRSRLIPLRGVVVVFGASNFPLAYGVCGGDTASALAAGCPVVVKEHPAHRETGRLIAETARVAIKAAGFDPDILGYIEDDGTHSAEIAKQLIEHPHTAAVGFTGSLAVGTQLHRLAATRPDPLGPIPVFAEMGSVNPSVIFPAALASREDAIIEQLAASISQRFGQQCTCPGIIFLHSNRDGRPFAEKLAARLAQTPSRRMLSPSVARGFEHAVATVAAAREVTRVGNPTPGGPVVLHCVGSEALAQFETVLATEMFGPGVLVVDDAGYDGDSMEFPGSLTMSIWFDPDSPEDLAAARRFLDVGRFGAGRIIFNGVPTGVRVCDSTTHGGPWPATNRPDTTAVGPRAIERWCRWVSFQNAPSTPMGI